MAGKVAEGGSAAHAANCRKPAPRAVSACRDAEAARAAVARGARAGPGRRWTARPLALLQTLGQGAGDGLKRLGAGGGGQQCQVDALQPAVVRELHLQGRLQRVLAQLHGSLEDEIHLEVSRNLRVKGHFVPPASPPPSGAGPCVLCRSRRAALARCCRRGEHHLHAAVAPGGGCSYGAHGEPCERSCRPHPRRCAVRAGGSPARCPPCLGERPGARGEGEAQPLREAHLRAAGGEAGHAAAARDTGERRGAQRERCQEQPERRPCAQPGGRPRHGAGLHSYPAPPCGNSSRFAAHLPSSRPEDSQAGARVPPARHAGCCPPGSRHTHGSTQTAVSRVTRDNLPHMSHAHLRVCCET